MAVRRSSQLEFNSPTVIGNMHWTTLVHDDSFDKLIKSVLEISRGCQCVLSDELMFTFMLTEELFNCQAVNQTFLHSILHDVGDVMIL